MDARAQHHHEKAAAVAREYGLEALDVDKMREIPAARWRAWAAMPETRRLIGWLAEGYVSNIEAAEVADTRRQHMTRPGSSASNNLARDTVVGRNVAEVYRKILRAVGELANREG